MKTKLGASIEQLKEEKREASIKRYEEWHYSEARKIALLYVDVAALKPAPLFKQDFWCKHNIHSNEDFSQNGLFGTTNHTKICVKCGSVRAYYGGWKKIGFLDPSKPYNAQSNGVQ